MNSEFPASLHPASYFIIIYWELKLPKCKNVPKSTACASATWIQRSGMADCLKQGAKRKRCAHAWRQKSDDNVKLKRHQQRVCLPQATHSETHGLKFKSCIKDLCWCDLMKPENDVEQNVLLKRSLNLQLASCWWHKLEKKEDGLPCDVLHVIMQHCKNKPKNWMPMGVRKSNLPQILLKIPKYVAGSTNTFGRLNGLRRTKASGGGASYIILQHAGTTSLGLDS